jgi:hypothetical protein
MASPSASVALSARDAGVPSTVLMSAIGARSTARFPLFTLMLNFWLSVDPAVVAVTDDG